MGSTRRGLLTTGLFLFGGYHVVKHGLPLVSDLVSGGFEFEALDVPQGFRRIDGGAVSTAFDPLVGLNPEQQNIGSDPLPDVASRFCDVLFDGLGKDADVLPIASFSDYNCPYCRVLTTRLAALEKKHKGQVRIAWHEYPLLGPSSEFAARAAIAAKMQGAYVAFHTRMMNARLIPSPDYLRRVAEDIGISPRDMLRDMDSPDVDLALAESAALARTFGLIGTPAIVVGRTLVQGAITDREIARLVKQEWADGPIPGCSQA